LYALSYYRKSVDDDPVGLASLVPRPFAEEICDGIDEGDAEALVELGKGAEDTR
jgi:hypothetical protein